jgi:uncharacterized protein YbbK (DUF523 family)
VERILVSACLLGRPVRYDGRSKAVGDPRLARWRDEGRLVLACPEMLGGLPTPRPAAEIEPGATAADVLAGRAAVRTAAGDDVTRAFLAGACATLQLALENGCHLALLQERSPSCGSLERHDGRFDGSTIADDGVTTALLRDRGVEVYGTDRLDDLADHLAALEPAVSGG